MTRLGFHAPLTRLYVFIKNEGNALWYYLDDGSGSALGERDHKLDRVCAG